MTDFSHLSKSLGDDTTAKYVFEEIEGEPWMLVRSATADNKAYNNALMQRQQSRRRRSSRRGLTMADLERIRKDDIELFSRHVILDWGSVVDGSGKEVGFSKEDCESFLGQIPVEYLDDLRLFCADRNSFLEDDLPDSEELAKN